MQRNDLQVQVRDNNVEQALRALKKKLQREGVFREMKLKQHFEKPSVKKAREKAEAVRRSRKLARKKLQRESMVSQVAQIARKIKTAIQNTQTYIIPFMKPPKVSV